MLAGRKDTADGETNRETNHLYTILPQQQEKSKLYLQNLERPYYALVVSIDDMVPLCPCAQVTQCSQESGTGSNDGC